MRCCRRRRRNGDGKVLEVKVEGWGRRMTAMHICHEELEGGWTVVEVEETVGR